jgi:hypothetical protein
VVRNIQTYEQLRSAVLNGQARPEGLAAVAYHGLLGGLKIICSMALSVPKAVASQSDAGSVGTLRPDSALVRLLANMVLLYQQEVSHVI